MDVTVITNSELGWDCVVAVISGDEDDAVNWLNVNHAEEGPRTAEEWGDICYVFTSWTISVPVDSSINVS